MIGILCFVGIRYAQFIYKYTNILDAEQIDYEVVYWNREGDEVPEKENWIAYEKRVNTFQPFYKKISHFIGFTSFMKKTIRKRKYDKLIILTTQTAVPLYFTLKKYSGRYIYDYRDITYERFSFYKKLVDSIIKHSYFTAISSKGFLQTLSASEKFVMSHNTRNFDFVNIKKNSSEKVRVVYWGMVRQPNFNYKICDEFAKDNRFELYYHGAGYHEEIKLYCNNKNYDNIHVTGAYKLDEIPTFVENTDILLNMYENDRQQKPAMTVKFYDSLKYGIPMIVNKGSYMAKIVEENKIGFVIDLEQSNCTDTLYNNYMSFDKDNYQRELIKVRQEISRDDDKFYEAVIAFSHKG